MKRRWLDLCVFVVGVASALHAQAQPTAQALRRVAWISAGDEAQLRPFLESFRAGMRQFGHKEGNTFVLDVRYAYRDPTRVRGLIRDAVTSRPDVLVVAGLTAARDARDATNTIPVVVATSSDMVDAGIVKSFARPGGNITGLNDLADELAAKRLELIKEALPKAARVALLVNPDFPATPKIDRSVQAAAGRLGIQVTRVDTRDPGALDAAIEAMEKSRPDAVLIGGDSLFVQRAKETIERARALRIPVVHYWPGTAEMGALFSHQADIFYNFGRAAYYVDRILKGAMPGDLPIEQPTRYELVVNKKTAKQLNVTLPPSFLSRADKVIE